MTVASATFESKCIYLEEAFKNYVVPRINARRAVNVLR